MNLYILNRNEEVVSVLSNEGENNFLSSAILKDELNKIKTLEVEVSTLSPEVVNLKEENFVLCQDVAEEWHMFIIKEINEVHGMESFKTVYSEDSSQELIDYIVEEELMGTTGTVQSLLLEALKGTMWTVGNVDAVEQVASFPTEVKNKSVLEVVHAIREVWNLQVRFRIEVTGNKITGRFVDMKKNIGSNLGKRFEYTKDIVQVERTVQSTNLKTAIIPQGGVPQKEEVPSKVLLKDNFQKETEEEQLPPIDITDIVWTTPTNPVNKPKGQNYLEIPEATAQWGYKDSKGKMKPRFIYYENTQITDANELINEAYKVLKDISKPVTHYKLDVLDLFALTGDHELSFESVNIGDIVTVIDHEFTPAIQLRTSIISKEVDLLSPENSSIELGSFIRNLVDNGGVDNDEKLQNVIQDIINGSLSTGLENLEESIKDLSGTFEDFKKEYNSNEVNFNWIRNSGFSNNLKYWNPLSSNGSVALANVSDIAYFEKAVKITGTASIEQTVIGHAGLFDNNVTVSGFVKGAGKFAVGIKYTDSANASKVLWHESKAIPTNTLWARYSFTTAIKKTSAMKTVTGIVVRFNNGNTTTHLTGLQLNLGTLASKYIPNSKDKIGQGVYDQVKDINNVAFANGVGYVYLEEEDGLWIYDKPSDNRPMKMTALKGGMLGIGKWNLQTQKWDINTFIDGNSVNASCINTGTLNADLIKAGTINADLIKAGTLNADLIKSGRIQSQDGTVSISMTDGRFSIGAGGKGNTTEITNTHVKISHSDGSYSRMSAEGFMWHSGATKNEYHHLLYAGEYTCASQETVRINLPAEFRGKPFKVVTSIKRVNTLYDVFSKQAPLISFYAHADTINQASGWIEIYASIRAWNKDGLGSGALVGDDASEVNLIKPTVAYWVFV